MKPDRPVQRSYIHPCQMAFDTGSGGGEDGGHELNQYSNQRNNASEHWHNKSTMQKKGGKVNHPPLT